MARDPLFRLHRAMAELVREMKRINDEDWQELAPEAEAVYDSLLDLMARVAELGGAPAELVADMRARGD